MNRLSSFNDFALTKSEMKGVRGGGCAVCSQGSGNSGTCGGYDFTRGEARALANEYNRSPPDPGSSYHYYVHCN